MSEPIRGDLWDRYCVYREAMIELEQDYLSFDDWLNR